MQLITETVQQLVPDQDEWGLWRTSNVNKNADS